MYVYIIYIMLTILFYFDFTTSVSGLWRMMKKQMPKEMINIAYQVRNLAYSRDMINMAY